MHRHLKQTQRGFTIIEIMVAIVLSMVLLYGVVEVFLGSRTSYRLQTGIARAQENARFALDIMARSVGMAGADSSGAQTFPPFNILNTQNNATPDTTLGFTTANGQASDTLSVTYQATTDCMGNTYGTPTQVTEFYYLGRDPNTNVSNLYCQLNGLAANTVPLVEGIENMQILYGMDLLPSSANGGSDGTADSYVSANNVTDWTKVASIRIALMASTIDNAGVTDDRIYHLLDAPPMGPINDNLARRIYTRTILLRNYKPQ